MTNNSFLLFAFLFIYLIGDNCYCSDQLSRPKAVVQKGKLTCLGEITAKMFTVGFNQDLITDEADIAELVATETFANRTTANGLITPLIVPNNKLNAIYVNSLLKVKGQIKYGTSDSSAERTSFIQLENIFINDVKQWKLTDVMDMSMVNMKINTLIKAYLLSQYNNNHNETTTASNNNNKTQKYEVETVIKVSSKNFEHVQIEMSFSFANHIWNNQVVYVKVNNETYWMDHHSWVDDAAGDCSWHYWTNPIKIVLPRKVLVKGHIPLTYGVKLSNSLSGSQCPEFLTLLNTKNVIVFDNANISVK